MYDAINKGLRLATGDIAGLIHSGDKLFNHEVLEKIDESKLDDMIYHAIERFGKTKLGQLLLYAKQSQNRQLIKEIVSNDNVTFAN